MESILSTLRWHLRQIYLQLLEHDCLSRAGALTYTTLFAVVPMMTVAFTIFSLLPEFAQVGTKIQDYLFANLVPSSGVVVRDKLLEFSSRAQGLTGLGFLFLFVTAFLMLVSIEKTFNQIWHVDESRRGLSRFLLYWGVLSLGPPLIAGGVFISLYLTTLPFLSDMDVLGLNQVFLPVLPYVLTALGFTLLYAAVPHCSVKLTHALLGGILAMLAFETVKWLFTAGVSRLSFETIYGPFAAVPLFLIWLYLVWVVILSGAIVVRTLSIPRERFDAAEPPLISAARVLQVLQRAHNAGDTVSEAELGEAVSLNRHQQQRIFQVLHQMKLIGTAEDDRWYLNRSLSRVSLWDLYAQLPEDLSLQSLEAVDDMATLVAPLTSLLEFGSNHMGISLQSALTATEQD